MLREDPKFCNAEYAAWWIWGINLWLGGNWCGSESLIRSNGYKVGISTQKPIRCNQGVLSTKSIKPIRGNQGVLSTTKSESISHIEKLRDRILDVYERLIDTTILCGDWKRCVTHSYTTSFGKCAIFLDPPYPSTNEGASVYDNNSLDGTVFKECIEYFLANYKNPNMRIILCGNSGDWEDCPEDIKKVYWKRGSGYAKNKSNREEVLWCSDACLFENVKEVM